MFRPILLLLPCLVLALTIDTEDELEMQLDDMEMQDEMDLDRHLDLDIDFEEEEKDRGILLGDRLGRPAGPVVGCGRSLEFLQFPQAALKRGQPF